MATGIKDSLDLFVVLFWRRGTTTKAAFEKSGRPENSAGHVFLELGVEGDFVDEDTGE